MNAAPIGSEMSVMAAVSVACLALSVATWRRRPKSGARPLTVLLLGIFVWLGAMVLSASVSGYGPSLAWERTMYVGQAAVVLGWVLFALEYTGESDLVTRRTVAVLCVEPVVVNLLVWTNPSHHLFWTTVEYEPGVGYDLGFALGPANWAHVTYSYVLALAGIVLLLRMAFRARRIYRRQALVVTFGAGLPLVASVNQLVSLPVPVETAIETVAPRMPIAFAVTAVTLSWAMYRYGLADAEFVAHRTIVDSIQDAEFVVDRDDRVVEMNARARELLGVEGAVVGQPAARVLACCDEVRRRYDSMAEGREEFAVETPDGQRFFELRAAPLEDGRERRQGRLFLLRDVTDRRRRERELERQKELLAEKNEELERQKEHLDKFASIVSHDLRNPLNAAQGYVELARETGDLSHLSAVQSAHQRMDDLVEEGLTLARRGETITETEWVDLATTASAAWKTVDASDATLTVDADVTVRADRARLRQVFENLFRNAIDHAGEDVHVEVGTVHREGTAGFYVVDDGPGIAPEECETVFESGFTTDEAGTGLGLSIVDSIVTAHGWTVRVVDGERRGARFEVTGVDVDTTRETAVATAESD